MVLIPEVAASLHMEHVILWQNGMVMVFDDQGKQMLMFQGPYEHVAFRIRCVFRGAWEYGDWNTGKMWRGVPW